MFQAVWAVTLLLAVSDLTDCAKLVQCWDRVGRVGYGQIRLADVQSTDHGLYTVVASDLHSNSSVSFWLFVNGMQTFDSLLTLQLSALRGLRPLPPEQGVLRLDTVPLGALLKIPIIGSHSACHVPPKWDAWTHLCAPCFVNYFITPTTLALFNVMCDGCAQWYAHRCEQFLDLHIFTGITSLIPDTQVVLCNLKPLCFCVVWFWCLGFSL